MKEQIGPRALLARLKRNLGPYSEELPELPLLAYRVLQGIDRQTLTLRWRSEELDRLRRDLRNQHAHDRYLMAGASLVISGILILMPSLGFTINPAITPYISIGLLVIGIVLLARRSEK